MKQESKPPNSVKDIKPYLMISIVFLLVAMCFPIRSYDWLEFHWRGRSIITETDLVERGFEFPPAYYILVLMIITAFILAKFQSKTGAVFGIILSVLILLMMPILAFSLVFKLDLFSSTETNETILFGYYLILLATLNFFLLTVINYRRHRKHERIIMNEAQSPLDSL